MLLGIGLLGPGHVALNMQRVEGILRGGSKFTPTAGGGTACQGRGANTDLFFIKKQNMDDPSGGGVVLDPPGFCTVGLGMGSDTEHQEIFGKYVHFFCGSPRGACAGPGGLGVDPHGFLKRSWPQH